MKCWGHNNSGQLGNGTTTGSSTPVDVTGITDAVDLSAHGYYHTCAVLSTGEVMCWGENEYGGLGNGTTTDSSTPVIVSGITDARAVECGYYHTCVLLDVDAGGGVKCWGYNGDGQLGNGLTSDSLTPVDVSGISDAVAVSGGLLHTCAHLSDGTVKCWGNNNYGQLGDGTSNGSSTPVSVVGF